jgi:hypothetical protein
VAKSIKCVDGAENPGYVMKHHGTQRTKLKSDLQILF